MGVSLPNDPRPSDRTVAFVCNAAHENLGNFHPRIEILGIFHAREFFDDE
jgi:hypothetical protein